MLEKIINSWIKCRLLKGYLKQRRVAVIVPLSDAKYVGILWNPMDEESVVTFDHLRKILNEKEIRSKGITYVKTKKETESLMQQSHSGIINRGNVGFLGRPQSGDGVYFLKEPFDILIDISMMKIIALQYILIHSKSKFKVGFKASEPNFYDLEIDVSSKPECAYLTEQIVYYLENINEKRELYE